MKKILLATSIALTATLSHSVLGPIPIYLNTEYRTDSPVIGSIASTLSFNEDDIKTSGANTFLDFLATVPSVGLIDAQGNVPAIFIRGFRSEHTLVLVDGVAIHDYTQASGASANALTTIALNDIEKIEIVKGSGSVLYGSSAIAGVIVITTKKGANGEHATISTKFGTHNSKTYNLSASSGNKNGFIRFTHNRYTTKGINARTADTTGEKDGIRNRSTQIKVGNEKFDISYLEAKNKTEYDDTFGTNQSDRLGDRHFTKIAINANHKFSDTWKTKLLIAQTKVNRNTGQSATTLGNKYKSTSITILNDIKIDNALLNVGLLQIDDKNTTLKQKLTSQDLFVNWQKNIAGIDVNTGARYIKHSKFSNKTIYNLGIAKYFDNGIKLTGAYGTAYRAPTLTELLGNNYYTASLGLTPETSKNTELGIEKQHSWGSSGVKIYKNKVKNRIAWNRLFFPNAAFLNKGKIETKGIEFIINANIADYSVDFSHDYNKSRENNGNTQSIRRPKNTTNLTLSKIYGKFNSRIQIIKKSSSLDIGNVKLNGYTLVNLSTNYTINNKAKVSLNIKNATDKDYTIVNGYNQLGRTIEVGLNYKF